MLINSMPLPGAQSVLFKGVKQVSTPGWYQEQGRLGNIMIAKHTLLRYFLPNLESGLRDPHLTANKHISDCHSII